LRTYEGLPYEEIADIMGNSVKAVKSLIYRAKGGLREALRVYIEKGRKGETF
jgi:DNA-directed RNA polymerase specialized sigma24 family protein